MSKTDRAPADSIRISCVEQEPGQFVAVAYGLNVRGSGRSKEEALGRLIVELAESNPEVVVLNT